MYFLRVLWNEEISVYEDCDCGNRTVNVTYAHIYVYRQCCICKYSIQYTGGKCHLGSMKKFVTENDREEVRVTRGLTIRHFGLGERTSVCEGSVFSHQSGEPL